MNDPFLAHLERPSKSVCPIFRRTTILEQFGSGVFIRIDDNVFLVTAAHVSDDRYSSPLWISSQDGFTQLEGYFAEIRIPDSGDRNDDNYDFSYYRLPHSVVESLHPELLILDHEDCDTFDTTAEGDAYTLIGYPAKKSRNKGLHAKTSLYSMSGEAVERELYSEFGINIQHHILIRYRRKKTKNFLTRVRSTAPHPNGMSGGGVFAWTKELPDQSRISQPGLCGITIEYNESENVFIVTRLNLIIACILKNNPDFNISVLPPISHQRDAL